jgi:hypothetical protein
MLKAAKNSSGFQQYGIGTQVVEQLLNNQKADIRIYGVLDAARDFWKSFGAVFEHGNVNGNIPVGGTLKKERLVDGGTTELGKRSGDDSSTQQRSGRSSGEVGQTVAGSTATKRAGVKNDEERRTGSDGHSSGSTERSVQAQTNRVQENVRGGTGADSRSSESRGDRTTGTRGSDTNDSVGEKNTSNPVGLVEQLQTYLDEHGSKNAAWAGAAKRALAKNDETQIKNTLAAAKKQFGGSKKSEQQAKTSASDEQIATAKANILKTIGEKINVEFEKMDVDSGEWTPGQVLNTIKLALNGDVVGASFHESFHEFVSILKKNGGAKSVAILERAAMNPLMQRKLERALDGHPEAQAQLKTPDVIDRHKGSTDDRRNGASLKK